MDRCVNCGIAFTPCQKRHAIQDTVLSIVRRWIAPQQVHDNQFLCNACWNIANDSLLNEIRPDSHNVGHRRVCICCGRSVLRTRFHNLQTATTRELAIYNVIKEWILPRVVRAQSVICHPCWMKADRASRHFINSNPSTSRTERNQMTSMTLDQDHGTENISGSSTHTVGTGSVDEPNVVQDSEPADVENAVPAIVPATVSAVVPTIVLPNYFRACETQNRCFIEGCNRRERNRITFSMRKMLLNNFNYYVPPNNRLCDYHLTLQNWDFINGIAANYIHSFTALHIEDLISLKDSKPSILDFENMEDHMFYFWVGLNKQQFDQLLNEIPQFAHMRRPRIALAAYLTKMRTGESDDRLSTLFQIPRSTLESLIKKARGMIHEYFVPHHIGINHINRNQMAGRNLMIPNSLFGQYHNERRPVIIFDGTYCYVEKSSNYMYQKNTYSLHKYRNLVKPFLMVCTDGHIVDVLGPYPATTSDADIMKKEFRNDSILREYFQPGDAFILDRGFRDALPLLNECGYRTFVPSTLQQGETQLSTLEANKSRAVTICRWVVEVVNGRFKRDYKLLRQNFFNNASRHIMIDFEVAAALINRFHPAVIDRDDAEQILRVIQANMSIENRLGEYVINNNINRRRADFQTITVDVHNLRELPQLTYSELSLVSLGSYQLKQARSYYGEHVREDGNYIIEVCREIDNDQLRELSTSNTLWLLRGRILSRHISRKIYFVYILVDSSQSGREAIVQYYCNCIVGNRTVGCCAHVMTIIWYLAWARYQDHIAPPAQFLDDLLIIYEEE